MMTRSGGMTLALCLAAFAPTMIAASAAWAESVSPDAAVPPPVLSDASQTEASPAPAGSDEAAIKPKVVTVGEKPVYPDFTFKLIAPPKPGQAPGRIVQIDPAEQRRLLAAVMPPPENPIPRGGAAPGLMPPPAREGAPAATGSYEWFWGLVPPEIGKSDGRFAAAIAALNHGPGGKNVVAPRMQAMQDIAALHGREILKATIGTQVSPALALAVIAVESGGRSKAVSTAGAVGMMQLIPATADRFGVDDSTDVGQNIAGGVKYLDWLMTEFDRDPLMVLAAYNAGENAVKGAGGVPAYAETRDYVPKVLAAWAVARGLCVTPPQLVTDGCVFAVNG
jgi:hypothetical protein